MGLSANLSSFNVKISTATDIPLKGEKWFKGMPLDIPIIKIFQSLGIEIKSMDPLFLRIIYLNITVGLCKPFKGTLPMRVGLEGFINIISYF